MCELEDAPIEQKAYKATLNVTRFAKAASKYTVLQLLWSTKAIMTSVSILQGIAMIARVVG